MYTFAIFFFFFFILIFHRSVQRADIYTQKHTHIKHTTTQPQARNLRKSSIPSTSISSRQKRCMCTSSRYGILSSRVQRVPSITIHLKPCKRLQDERSQVHFYHTGRCPLYSCPYLIPLCFLILPAVSGCSIHSRLNSMRSSCRYSWKTSN